MTNPTIVKAKATIRKFRIPKPWDSIVIFVLNILILIPVFIILHQVLIDPDWPIHLDRILLFLAIIIGMQFLLSYFKKFIFIILIIYLGTLIWGTLFQGYGFNSVYEDYRAMIFAMSADPNPQDVIVSKLLPFPNKSKIEAAVEYNNPKVRNYALMAT